MQLCLFQTAHVNMNTNVISVTHSGMYRGMYIQWPVTVERRKRKMQPSLCFT